MTISATAQDGTAGRGLTQIRDLPPRALYMRTRTHRRVGSGRVSFCRQRPASDAGSDKYPPRTGRGEPWSAPRLPAYQCRDRWLSCGGITTCPVRTGNCGSLASCRRRLDVGGSPMGLVPRGPTLAAECGKCRFGRCDMAPGLRDDAFEPQGSDFWPRPTACDGIARFPAESGHFLPSDRRRGESLERAWRTNGAWPNKGSSTHSVSAVCGVLACVTVSNAGCRHGTSLTVSAREITSPFGPATRCVRFSSRPASGTGGASRRRGR